MNDIFSEVAAILGLPVELVKWDMSNYELLRLMLNKYKEVLPIAETESSE